MFLITIVYKFFSFATQPNYFGTMLVEMGVADSLLGGATYSTADTVRPALQIIKTKPGNNIVSSCFILVRPGATGENEVLVIAHISRAKIREDKSVGMACDCGFRAFCTRYTWRNGSVKLQFAFNGGHWIFYFCFQSSISHFFYIRTFARAKCRVAKECNFWVHAKDFSAFNRLTRRSWLQHPWRADYRQQPL